MTQFTNYDCRFCDKRSTPFGGKKGDTKQRGRRKDLRQHFPFSRVPEKVSDKQIVYSWQWP